jgi:hypothetical protein
MKTIDQLTGRKNERSGNRMNESPVGIATAGGRNPKNMAALASLALALVVGSCSSKDGAKLASAEDLHAHLVAEREMMSNILAGEMHGINGITDDPRDTIAYHGLHSYQSADNYEDRAFIPWNGTGGYVVFEVKPGLGPFRYYGITVGENGKSGAVGAAGIVEVGESNTEDGK